jgi:hypothetical protein
MRVCMLPLGDPTEIQMFGPILTAILGLSVGLGVIAFLSHTVEVPTSAPTLANNGKRLTIHMRPSSTAFPRRRG